MRQRLARQHLVALRRVVEEDRFHGRNLLQVGGLQPLHHVLIRVVRAALVVQRVLDELESRNAYCIEAQVVGAAGVAVGDGGYAQVLERRDPLRKDGRDGRVALGVDAANLAGAVIHIEVTGDELLFRLYFEGPSCAPHELRQLQLVGRRRGFGCAKVDGAIALRAEDALFFSGP